ncbi:basolateral NaK(2Cl) cotransporter [Achlya hypogyna]|uniref:Basolateral NaK(2Cl) cotransporter n=1 Tax=Achlya hypogyna TaxID=1202772 RepID=A0A1V9ZSF1_ACHHY|nr:basolateral NaK(2Cl) cotransporter [Achlya hypogyna]
MSTRGRSFSDIEDPPTAYTPFLAITTKGAPATHNQLGTFNGVYVPCLLNIIGVILFLRLGWAIGQAGVLGMLGIFFIAETQAVLTVLSASAIASNGSMRGGGSYYLISRSLGPEFGGAIGLQFYLLYASGVAMYLVGLAEEVQQTWLEHSSWEKKHVVVAVAAAALVSTTAIALLGAQAFAKVNQYLFVVQFACIAFGAVVVLRPTRRAHPSIAILVATPHALASGGQVTGPSMHTLRANLHANYTSERNACGVGQPCDFAGVFAVVFPLATGFMEGLNLSGDLKHPGKSIPLGSLAAIATACVVYLSLIMLFGSSFPGATLRTNYTFFQEASAAPTVVIAGLLVSCYTSGLGALFGASRILQAIARDRLFPGGGARTAWLGSGSAVGDEPQAAVLFTTLLSFAFVLLGDLDVLAPLCTSFFCLAYAAVNATAFILQVSGVPNFRPTFRGCNWPVSLAGVVLNLGVMVYLNALYAAATLLVLSVLFGYLYIAAPATGWGSVSQALIYHQVRKYLLRLDRRKEHAKYWRPAVLHVPASPTAPSVAFCNLLKKGGLYLVGDIVVAELSAVLVAPTVREGYRGLLQLGGLGGMDVNTLVLDWAAGTEVWDIAADARLLRKNAVVLRHGARLPQAAATTVDVWLATDDAPAHVMLMLQLAHVLLRTPVWQAARLRLLRVGGDDSAAALRDLADDLRIPLAREDAIVLPRDGRELAAVVAEHSARAGLVVLALPEVPMPATDAFALALNRLTVDLPPTLLVHCAQDESVVTTAI